MVSIKVTGWTASHHAYSRHSCAVCRHTPYWSWILSINLHLLSLCATGTHPKLSKIIYPFRLKYYTHWELLLCWLQLPSSAFVWFVWWTFKLWKHFYRFQSRPAPPLQLANNIHSSLDVPCKVATPDSVPRQSPDGSVKIQNFGHYSLYVWQDSMSETCMMIWYISDTCALNSHRRRPRRGRLILGFYRNWAVCYTGMGVVAPLHWKK